MSSQIQQTREIGKDMFLSLSEETKIQMARQQFFVPENEWNEVREWINSMTTDLFYLEQKPGRSWFMFYSKEDAVNFKLTWVEGDS